MADETKIPGTVEEPAPPGGPPAPEQPEIPDVGKDTPDPAGGKVIDLSDVRAAGSEKSDARQEWEIPIAELEAKKQKPKRGCAPKAKTEDKAELSGKADKVPCEISLENHIHFGLKQAGKWVDPVETMGLK